MLQVTTFGAFHINWCGAPLHLGLGMHASEVAAFLFLQRQRSATRNRIIGEFWPRYGENQARQSLNTALWDLRRALRPLEKAIGSRPLDSRGEEVSIGRDLPTEVDAILFAQKIEEICARSFCAAAESTVDDKTMEALDAELKIYAGDFLASFGSSWIMPLRTRFETLFIRGQVIRMRGFTEREQLEAAIACAQIVLRFDPYRENTQCDLMRLYVLNGQRAAAIRQYNMLSDLLQNQLKISPMPEITSLRDKIIDGSFFKNLTAERAKIGRSV